MRQGFRKYLSTIVLILLCVVCATIFYINASDIFKGNENNENGNGNTNTNININTDVPPPEIPVAVIDASGTILSEYYCDTNLRAEWVTLKNEGSDMIYLGVELYLDSLRQPNATDGYLIVNGQKTEFSYTASEESPTLLATCTQSIQSTEDVSMRIEAYLNVDIKEDNGVSLSSLELSGNIVASEKYKTMAQSSAIPLKHISQYPELPSGDEITSLAMVLSYLKYDVDKCDLCDVYLEKGPVGYTNFNEANVGNPRNAYNSYGCLPPVIIKATNKYIYANGGNFKAYDYSKTNTDELYYEVSQGNPVIVWTCEDFDITPSISRIWIVDGETLYLKSNMACMVLIGYDFEKNTVTLANPAGNIFDIDMSLFEKRFIEMGAYSIVIK